MCITIRYIEISILAKFRSPAVLTYESAVLLRRLVEVVPAVIVVPSDYDYVMIDALCAVIVI